jgi:hypothetical protein
VSATDTDVGDDEGAAGERYVTDGSMALRAVVPVVNDWAVW